MLHPQPSLPNSLGTQTCFPRHSDTARDRPRGALLPHHVELIQAQSVYARPLATHGLPEGLKEQVL